ncbi:MAG: GGDEF domain-containing protein [Pseudomonadota bacterium]
MPYTTRMARRRGSDINVQVPQPGARVSPTNGTGCKPDLLDSIGTFISKHHLQVTSANLSAICAGLSGENAKLADAISQREASGQPIDQRWLDTLTRFDLESNDRLNELETLMDKLEHSLIRFARSAKNAQDETSGHRNQLDRHITQMRRGDVSGRTGSEFERIIELSRSALSQLEQVEKTMERSQTETSELRDDLAKARIEADVDHLTRLPNRRAFERRLNSAAAEARAKKEPLCVAFCDVDNFKSVNDRYGHEAGDRILCAIADTLSAIASDECFIARHGGEEFVLLFYGFTKERAFRKLESARRAMAGRRLMDRETGKPFGRITFSGGIAEVTEDIDTRSALARADQALYKAKEAGRNKILSD